MKSSRYIHASFLFGVLCITPTVHTADQQVPSAPEELPAQTNKLEAQTAHPTLPFTSAELEAQKGKLKARTYPKVPFTPEQLQTQESKLKSNTKQWISKLPQSGNWTRLGKPIAYTTSSGKTKNLSAQWEMLTYEPHTEANPSRAVSSVQQKANVLLDARKEVGNWERLRFSRSNKHSEKTTSLRYPDGIDVTAAHWTEVKNIPTISALTQTQKSPLNKKTYILKAITNATDMTPYVGSEYVHPGDRSARCELIMSTHKNLATQWEQSKRMAIMDTILKAVSSYDDHRIQESDKKQKEILSDLQYEGKMTEITGNVLDSLLRQAIKAQTENRNKEIENHWKPTRDMSATAYAIHVAAYKATAPAQMTIEEAIKIEFNPADEKTAEALSNRAHQLLAQEESPENANQKACDEVLEKITTQENVIECLYAQESSDKIAIEKAENDLKTLKLNVYKSHEEYASKRNALVNQLEEEQQGPIQQPLHQLIASIVGTDLPAEKSVAVALQDALYPNKQLNARDVHLTKEVCNELAEKKDA